MSNDQRRVIDAIYQSATTSRRRKGTLRPGTTCFDISEGYIIKHSRMIGPILPLQSTDLTGVGIVTNVLNLAEWLGAPCPPSMP